MRYSTTAIVLAAMTIGEVAAGPTHVHLHRKAHEKKDVDWAALDWNNMGIDWASAYSAGMAEKAGATPAPAAPAAPVAAVVAEPTPAPAAPATSPSVGNDVTTAVEGVEALFAGIVGASNSRTSFGGSTSGDSATGDFHMGNYGSPYGSNIIKVASADGYDFTNTFKNTQSVPITVNIWNKVGSDKQPLSGSALAPKNTALTFSLAPGASQVVAFAPDSQIGWAESCSATAESGAFATTWGEANFNPTGSGYDVSAIMNPNNNNYNMAISSVEAPACTSDRTQNFWLTASDPVGTSDGSCYVAQSTAHLTTIMGGTV